ncbi:MAG: DUF167 domain-containing protein [Candidatus Omnitrophica bacterium]|nr:DUF167 domain-containing protein [Candidatus Omnitrophota bacterium]
MFKLEVRVKPQSPVERVELSGSSALVRVKAKPTDGKANGAVVRLLARHFGVSRSQVVIRIGKTSRRKVIEIHADKP